MKISCPSCGQHLDAPEELANQTIDCPACNVKLTVPAPPTPEPAPSPAPPPKNSSPKESTATPQKKAKDKKGKSRLPIIAAVGLACILIMGVVTFFLSDSSQTYEWKDMDGDTFYLEVNSDGSFVIAPPGRRSAPVFGNWEETGNGSVIICAGKARGTNQRISISFDKNSLELVEFKIQGLSVPLRMMGNPQLKKSNHTIDTR